MPGALLMSMFGIHHLCFAPLMETKSPAVITIHQVLSNDWYLYCVLPCGTLSISFSFSRSVVKL